MLNETALQRASCDSVQLGPLVLKMEAETDLDEVDKFPDRACQVNLTHCQQRTNAMPIFNPVPDGKKSCPRLTLNFKNCPQLELEYKYAKVVYFLVCWG